MPFVAAIGGPITLFIVAAVLVAGILSRVLFGGWQKTVAKKFVKEYEKANANNQYEEFINKFWIEDTTTAFNTAADAMEEEWLRLIEVHKDLVNNFDPDDIKRKIKEAEGMKFF